MDRKMVLSLCVVAIQAFACVVFPFASAWQVRAIDGSPVVMQTVMPNPNSEQISFCSSYDMWSFGNHYSGAPPQNVILMIGDGMGFGQIELARYSLGTNASLNMDLLPYSGIVSTTSLGGEVTDSAAAATALATGNKTRNGILSMTTEGENLVTVLELAESGGKATGLVTTCTLYDATTAAFAAHVPSRASQEEIAQQMVEKGIEVMLGGGQDVLSTFFEDARSMGYQIVEDRSELLNASHSQSIIGSLAFANMDYERDRDPSGQPSLAEMTDFALETLSTNENGFFLMVEGGRIDHACHSNNRQNTAGDTLSFDVAVGVALDFAKRTPCTLLLVTADHETGGLSVSNVDGNVTVHWNSTAHTANKVPVLSYGPRASRVCAFDDNTDIGEMLLEIINKDPILTVTVCIRPEILNLQCTITPISGYVEFPWAISLEEVNVSSVLLNWVIQIDPAMPVAIGDYDNDSISDLAVSFNRASFSGSMISRGPMYGNISLAVAGQLENSTEFEGEATVTVRMGADLNSDGYVDGSDLIVPARAFGSFLGHPRWDSLADQNEDGTVDGSDIIIIARQFGKKYD